jgi:putative transposase
MVTRRCTQRTFLMRPDPETNSAFLYCLTVAANRTDVAVLFFLAMSNHYHAGIVDRSGRLPEFLEMFHKLFAKHQNALRGRRENFWASEQTSVVELVGPDDVLRKMVYTLGNPVKDHLVAHAREWPGCSSFATNVGGVDTLHATRPVNFFRKDGPLADDVSLTLHRPPGFEHLSAKEFSDLLSSRIRDEEQAAEKERSRTGIQVLGVRRVLEQDWRDSPSTHEPRRALNPRIACANSWRRRETTSRNKAFVAAYREARDRWRAGLPTVFPEGTYWLRRFAGAACGAPPG